VSVQGQGRRCFRWLQKPQHSVSGQLFGLVEYLRQRHPTVEIPPRCSSAVGHPPVVLHPLVPQIDSHRQHQKTDFGMNHPVPGSAVVGSQLVQLDLALAVVLGPVDVRSCFVGFVAPLVS
jgi:hypothetical protein